MGKRVSDFQLLEACLAKPGATDEEIGKVVGLSRVQVSRRKHSSSFKKLLSDHTRDALKPLILARVKAVRRLCEALDSADERVSLKACEIVMERSEGLAEKETSKEDSFDDIIKVLEKMKNGNELRRQQEENFKNHRMQMTDAEFAELQKRSRG